LLLKDAQALLDRRDFAAAERAFARVLSIDRNSGPGYTGLGLTLLARGQQEEAFQALQRALQLDERQPRALYGLASLFLQIDFPDEAIRRLQKAVEIDPNDAESWFLLGVSLRDVGRSDAAEEALRKAVALKPDGRYLANLAWTQGRAGRTDEARKNFEAAVAASPKDSIVLGLYGGTLAEEAEKVRTSTTVQRAEKLLSDALAADANNYNAHYSLGSLALLNGDAKKAVPHLESAIQSQPDMLQAWFRLGKAYAKLGNKERADYCQKAFKAMSDYELERSSAEEQARTDLKNPALRLKLARVYARGSEVRRALNQYGMYLTLKPGDTAVQKERDALVESLRKQGKLPQMELFDRMLRSSTEAQAAPK
jgi:tetratricopeptide (TPR) repeat protein